MSVDYNRTIRIYQAANDVADALSVRFGISKSAVIEALLLANKDVRTLTIPARDGLCRATFRRVMTGPVRGKKAKS